MDEFLQSGAFDSDGDGGSEEETPKQNGLKKKGKKKALKAAQATA